MARDQHITGSKGARGWLALVAALFVTACGSASRTPPSNGAPTIVSLNPCIDAILVELADPDQVLALSHYSRDPGSSSIPARVAAGFAITGGTAEEIIALNPDLVLASTFLPQPTRRALERAGLRVETFGSPGTLEDSLDQVQQIADLIGHAQRGTALTTRITAAPAQPQGREYSALLWQPGQIVPGDSTLIAQQLQWARLASHSSAMGLRQADFVSLERILSDPPEILLVAGNQPGQSHPALAQIRSTLVAEFDPALLYCGGPTIPKLRERLIEIRSQRAREYYSAPD